MKLSLLFDIAKIARVEVGVKRESLSYNAILLNAGSGIDNLEVTTKIFSNMKQKGQR